VLEQRGDSHTEKKEDFDDRKKSLVLFFYFFYGERIHQLFSLPVVRSRRISFIELFRQIMRGEEDDGIMNIHGHKKKTNNTPDRS